MSGVKKIDTKNFLTRTASGVIIFACILGFGLSGGWFFFSFTAALSFIGLYEFYRIFGIHKMPAGIIGFILAVLYWILLNLEKTELILPLIVIGFLILMAVYVFDFQRMDPEKAMASFAGFLYVPVLMSYMVRIRLSENGAVLLWLVFIAAWGCDIFAYLSGILLGRHKMAPVLSPKKSWEGAVGGVLGAVLLGALYGLIFKNSLTMNRPVPACALITGAGALISMVGDLTASAFKRHRGIKDYSNLIPGHGGILDRFDSVIFVAPVIYYLISLF